MSALHLFIPNHKHNHKPRLLHGPHLAVLIGLYIMSQAAISFFSHSYPNVLGYASSIPVQQIITETNIIRAKQELPALKENQKLTAAATAKAKHMFANNYWSHTAPDGTTPWYFILDAGYNYLHAGENLARDFKTADGAVTAWTKSPTHMANLVSNKYQDIGIAVVDGVLDGKETTLIVQMFGSIQSIKDLKDNKDISGTIPDQAEFNLAPQVLAEQSLTSAQSVISPFDLSRSISLAFIILITTVLALDWFIVLRRNLIRISGKNWAHITYFVALIIILIILKQGIII
jgi:hypothetical protein